MVGGLGQRLGPRGDALSLSQDDLSAFCMRAGDTPRMVNFVFFRFSVCPMSSFALLHRVERVRECG